MLWAAAAAAAWPSIGAGHPKALHGAGLEGRSEIPPLWWPRWPPPTGTSSRLSHFQFRFVAASAPASPLARPLCPCAGPIRPTRFKNLCAAARNLCSKSSLFHRRPLFFNGLMAGANKAGPCGAAVAGSAAAAAPKRGLHRAPARPLCV